MEAAFNLNNNKPKAVVFYTYLPPWRVDVFNVMSDYYDLTIVFLNAEIEGFTYDRDQLLKKIVAKVIFLNKGFNVGNKSFRTGVCRILKICNPKVVFIHEYSPTNILIASFIRLRLFDFQLIITTSDNLKISENISGIKKYARSYILKSAKGIVVYSENVKNWYKSHFPQLKVEICPNIQNPKSLLSYQKDFPLKMASYQKLYRLVKPIILYIGRLEKVKGVDLLIQAYSHSLKDSHQLVLVGEGSQEDALKALAIKYQVEDSVIFTGPYYGGDLYAWYYLADFFVLPSRYEPFGAVVNEALIFGCPVLASKNIGALDYINEGNNGLIFDPENNESFVDTLFKASNSFTKGGTERDNLMLVSFNQYSKVFYEIAQP